MQGGLFLCHDTHAATVHHGGRTEAVKHALKANAVHGLRRSNEDKRRSVEIALQEFGNLTDNAISKMCGVDNHTVKAVRDTLGNSQPEKRIGQDGKTYPASKPQTTEVNREQETTEQANPRRSVEIALQEFGNLSSRAIAEMCGVGHQLVQHMKQVDESSTSTVTGQDGKTYPATKPQTVKNAFCAVMCQNEKV